MEFLETSRLRLRPGREQDTEGLCLGLNDWNVARWLVRPPYPYASEHAQDFIALTRTSVEGGFFPYRIIADRVSDAIVGVISLEPAEERAELGYWLLPAHQGQGLITEAAIALMAEGVTMLPTLKMLHADTVPANHASQAVLQRLGFAFVEARSTQKGRDGSGVSFVYEKKV